MKKNFKLADNLLAECHIASATLKAICSWKMMQINKRHLHLHELGFLKSTYIGENLKNNVPSVTYEGDNSVLMQQTGKYLIKLKFKLPIEKPKLFDINCIDSIENTLNYIMIQ